MYWLVGRYGSITMWSSLIQVLFCAYQAQLVVRGFSRSRALLIISLGFIFELTAYKLGNLARCP